MKFTKLSLFLLAMCLSFSLVAQEEEEKPKVNFKFGGYAKTDGIFTQYNNGPYSGLGRDFNIPGTTPVGNSDVYRYLDFHAKESRFNFDVSRDLGGKKLRAFVEMDFMLAGQGDERVSNSYNPRLRHFFLEYDKLLVGQTWSTFMIVILPDDLDFIGAPEGVVFCRQPMVRLTLGTWQFALENAFTTYTDYQQSGRDVSDEGLLPDVVARKNFKIGKSTISVAAIGRLLEYRDDSATVHRTIGTGATVGGKIKIGSRDDLRFMATSGIGLGRYVGLNFITAATVDANLNLVPRFSHNEYISYRHFWTSKLRSSFTLSYFSSTYDNTREGGGANVDAFSASGNLVYSPVENLHFGVEPIFGYRKVVSGDSGSFIRVQASAKYAFSFKTSNK